MSKAEWFPKFAALLASQAERPPAPAFLLTKAKLASEPNEWSCFRFWYQTPHFNYHFAEPRSKTWVAPLKVNTVVPQCAPIQEKRTASELCLNSLRPLFKLLEGIVYHPLSGTELGFARIGTDAKDTDIDIFVDVPPKKLAVLLQTLSPKPYVSGNGYTAELHWKPRDCGTAVHMQFNDRIADEIGNRTSASDLCICTWKSISGSEFPLYCHNNARYRMEVQYGPSWWLPVSIKNLDMPYWGYTHRSHQWMRQAAVTLKKLRKAGKGLITRSDLPDVIPDYADEAAVLAQLNFMLFCSDATAFRSRPKLVSELLPQPG